MRRVLVCIILLAFYCAGCVCADSFSSEENLGEKVYILQNIKDHILSGLLSFDDANEVSAEKLSKAGISGEGANAILKDKLSSVSYGHSSLVITHDGIISAAAPDKYTGLIGEDLSYQPQVQVAKEEKQPVMSDLFLLKEGFNGVSLSYPIFSNEQEYLGYTDITFRPEEFLKQYIAPVTRNTSYDVMILQADGVIIYETNEEEIGRNALTDTLYDSVDLRRAAVAITSNQSGIVTYSFWNQNWNAVVSRQAMWESLTHDKMSWRIVLISDVQNISELQDSGVKIAVIDGKPGMGDSASLNESISNLDTFMTDAVSHIRMNGKEEALSTFNNLSGPFVSGEHYIFAYDYNGTTLALPYQPGLIGKKRMNLTDVNGFEILPSMIDVARMGGGYLYSVYQNPVDKFSSQLKMYSIIPIGDEWFIGSGIYLPKNNVIIDESDLSNLKKRVHLAVSHAEEVGKEQAITDFNDLNGTFADGGAYIFAYDYNGTTLALPHQKEVIGTDRYDFSDRFGIKITRMEIDAAKRGGGYVYIVYYNPETGGDELKLCYVLPAGDDWLVGSGIYTGQKIGI